MTITLRPRQEQALADLRRAYAEGSRAPILRAATGFGKTTVAAEIVRQAVAKGRNVWFLAHLKEILDDTTDRLLRAGIEHGQIRAGRSVNYRVPVQVVAVQTAVRRSGLPRPDLVIVDECHLAVANTYRQVLEAAGWPLLLGLTGTPERLDGRGLGEVFDRIVHTCETADLIAEGLLAPVRVFAPPGVDLSGLRNLAGKFNQEQAGELLSKPQVVGDALSHWQRLCMGRRGVAFCTTVAHAQAVAEQWQRAGFRAVAVHGDSDDAERREAVAGLRAGRLDLVACAQLWIAGVDVPEIDAVIWLRPTQSLTAWLQGNGRGLRIAPGKADLLILDHVGNCARLRHPLHVHEWSLEGKRKRDKTAALSVKVCPRCFAAMSSRASECGECGHRFAVERRELQQVDGELVELRRGVTDPGSYRVGDKVRVMLNGRLMGPAVIKDITRPLSTAGRYLFFLDNGITCDERDIVPADKPAVHTLSRREQAKAQTLEDLVAVGQRRGMKNPRGWARHVLAARQTKGRFERVVA